MKIDEQLISELESRVNTEHQKDIAAIKRVLKLLRKNKLDPQLTTTHREVTLPPPPTQIHVRPVPPVPPKSVPPPYPFLNGQKTEDKIEQNILSLVEKFPGEFTFAELMQAFKNAFPNQLVDRKVISGVIFQNKGKRIRVIQPGWGRKQAIYSKMSFMPKKEGQTW